MQALRNKADDNDVCTHRPFVTVKNCSIHCSGVCGLECPPCDNVYPNLSAFAATRTKQMAAAAAAAATSADMFP